jgi:NADH:ubiquinone oxidoreductase subunit K
VPPLNHLLALGAILFSLGTFGVLTRRNAIGILMAVELMLNGVNINLIVFARCLWNNSPLGQLFVVFVITIAAVEAAVGLALVISIFRTRRTVNADEVDLMRW